MSFTDTVKEELIHQECSRECCALSEICAALLLGGGIAFRGRGRYGLSLTVNRVSASRYYFTLIKKYLGVSCQVRTLSAESLARGSQVELSFPEEAVPEVMRRLCLLDDTQLFGVARTPDAAIVENPCCRAAFLKSAFIITGYISNPEKEYSLSLSCTSLDCANALADIMHSLDISAGVSTRRKSYVVYAKDMESLSVFLTLTGAHSARLALENARIVKQLRNSTNRLTNCDNNNIERTVRTAQQQMEDIRFLAERVGFDRLPSWAREIASLRLENPEASLTELGALCDPPLAKSGVNSRLRRLSEMARQLREGN